MNFLLLVMQSIAADVKSHPTETQVVPQTRLPY